MVDLGGRLVPDARQGHFLGFPDFMRFRDPRKFAETVDTSSYRDKAARQVVSRFL
jgi:hypothetical protein